MSNLIEKGYVYIARVENNIHTCYPKEYYKVGYSINPNKRMSQLKIDTKLSHTLVKKYEFGNYTFLETVSHSYLREYNIYGEYFNASLEIIEEKIEKAINDISGKDYETIHNELHPGGPLSMMLNTMQDAIEEFVIKIRAEHLKELEEKYIFVEKDGNIESRNKN